MTERLIVDWVGRAIETAGINSLVLGGGVLMNVKANKRISEIDEVSDVSFCPGAGDESTAIGAALVGLARLREQAGEPAPPQRLEGVYFGPAYGEQDMLDALEKPEYKGRFSFESCPNMAERVAAILAEGGVVARMAGRMEFGARALGNRSILADPRNRDVVDIINRKIKSRDFWMPFAGTILSERESDYILNPKSIAAPYMMLAFETTSRARTDLPAAMHPHDQTMRPQVLKKSANESYWQIIKEFEKVTGVGGVLNTSFNLHGEPIVCSPEDALHTLVESDLEWLATETLLVRKLA